MSKGKSILIVDDEPDLREILADEFRFAEFEVTEAANGIDALVLYKTVKPAAVISDIRMPGGDGVTLAKGIKALEPTDSRVFLITGFADLTAADAFDFGVDGFFTKPFHLEEVRDAIMRTLLPDEERWQLRFTKPASANLILKTTDFAAELKAGHLSVGRGGLFIPADKMEALPMSARPGDVINLKTETENFGMVTLRWNRCESKTLPLGVGVEFLSLEPSFLKIVLGQDSRNQAAYIPSKLTS